MVAAQNRVQILLSTDNSKKVETTIHHAKQPQLSLSVSMIESLNEEIENFPLWVFVAARSDAQWTPDGEWAPIPCGQEGVRPRGTVLGSGGWHSGSQHHPWLPSSPTDPLLGAVTLPGIVMWLLPSDVASLLTTGPDNHHYTHLASSWGTPGLHCLPFIWHSLRFIPQAVIVSVFHVKKHVVSFLFSN
jgi:hypothetical protein